MPEGDTVLRTARRLHAALAGTPLVRCDLRWAELATIRLEGWTTVEVVARGKHILQRLTAPASVPDAEPSADTGRRLTLHSHLRMEGQWRVAAAGPAGERAARRPDVRAVLGTQAWTAVGLRLGMLDLVPTGDEHLVVGHLGPDLLDPGWSTPLGVGRLVCDPARPLVDALLDQRVLCGVGTFWACEGLFVERLHPWSPVGEVEPARLTALLERIRRLMLEAARTGWQSSTGSTRRDQLGYVHGRSGRPCRRCGTVVRVALTGHPPQQRTVFSCPACQGGLAPGDSGEPQRPLGASSHSPGRMRRSRD